MVMGYSGQTAAKQEKSAQVHIKVDGFNQVFEGQPFCGRPNQEIFSICCKRF